VDTLLLTRPDDWHLHLRDGAAMADVLPLSATRFGRALIMPNLSPPVRTTDDALAYRSRILRALPSGSRFQPLMTLYLTDSTSVDDIVRAAAEPSIVGAKLYPAGATTNSESGVTSVDRVEAVLSAMEEHDLPLLVHGEVTDPGVDVFDREAVFIDRVLVPLVRRLPRLRVVLEHVTTREGVAFVQAHTGQVAATITAHHLLLNRNAIFAGGLCPHHYCLPVLKGEAHRQAVLEVAASAHPGFFLGTDSAPHPRHRKESACGCAGIFTAHAAIELYAEIFEACGALDNLEAFAALNGATFYRLPPNAGTVTLVKESWRAPDELPFGGDVLIPLRAGGEITWRLAAC
jgi:dihydroorotase